MEFNIDGTCGANCIQMLLERHGIYKELSDIFESVAGDSWFGTRQCRSVFMIKYLLGLGFHISCISVRNLKKVLKICNEKGLDVILHVRVSPDIDFGHYVLFVKYDSESEEIFVRDPGKNNDLVGIKFKVLKKMMEGREFSDVPKSNTILVASSNAKHNEIVKKYICECSCFVCNFVYLNKYTNEILCPEVDEWCKICN